MIVTFTRIEGFSAAHRLNSPHMTEAENAEFYGPCNHIHGHGHNYKVEFAVKGQVDTKTGTVAPLERMKSVIKANVLDVLDHTHLDLDIEWFQTRPSTTENLAAFIWNQVHDDLLPWALYKVKVWETEKNIVTYKGEE